MFFAVLVGTDFSRPGLVLAQNIRKIWPRKNDIVVRGIQKGREAQVAMFFRASGFRLCELLAAQLFQYSGELFFRIQRNIAYTAYQTQRRKLPIHLPWKDAYPASPDHVPGDVLGHHGNDAVVFT